MTTIAGSERAWGCSARAFEEELCAAGLKESSVETYVSRAGVFLRWLVGAYEPGR